MKKSKKIFLLAWLFLAFSPSLVFLQSLPIIPKPVSLETHDGAFIINKKTSVNISTNNKELINLYEFISSSIENVIGFKPLLSDNKTNTINFILDSGIQNDEGYKLSITKEKIIIVAKNGAGIFYGIQSLIQLFPLEKSDIITIPSISIEDYPRFKWRGTHLDVCRHFFPVEFVKKYIDILAAYKINTFHWHLTDDQGWRIEIKQYPKLTQIGSMRKETMGDGKPYGGYYTQEQIREVVEYAKRKYITIVPEIEMPGHALAALASYPEYSCTGGPFEVETTWGVFDDIFCAGKESTFEFLENILTEVIELFSGEIIHIGGDEAPKTRWQKCELCQYRMKKENLKDEHELQSYFVQRIEKFLNSKGKKIIGWDEILEGGLAPNAAVMSWRGTEGGIAAAKMKHYVVMSPGTYCYFDHYQGLSGEPKAIGGYTPLEKVYSYEPVPDDLNDEEAKYIWGAQANMWSEYYESTDHVEYMLLPRLCALSEVVWTPASLKNYDDFLKRMAVHYNILSKKGYNFRVPPPLIETGELIIDSNQKIELNSYVKSAKIYYTLDGSEPDTNSLKYSEPITVFSPTILKSKTIMSNGKSSPTSTVMISLIDKTINGLHYNYYEGDWDYLPKFWEMKPDKKGKTNNLSLTSIEHREDLFGIDLFGFINIENSGDYIFYLVSDDGSKLFIDNQLVVDNDGLHEKKEATGKIYLEKGKHPFKVFYFEKKGSQYLGVEYEGPGIKRKPIPANVLYFDN